MASVQQLVHDQASHGSGYQRSDMDQRKDHGRLYGVDRHNHFQVDDAFAVSAFRIECEANDCSEIFDTTKRRAKDFRRLTRIDQAEMISIRHVVASPDRRGVCDTSKNYSNVQTLIGCDNLRCRNVNCAVESNTTCCASAIQPRQAQNWSAKKSCVGQRAVIRLSNSESRAVPPSRPARVAEILEPQTPWMSPRVLHSSSRAVNAHQSQQCDARITRGRPVVAAAEVASGPREAIQSRAA
jgi:hypothetical protein